MPQMQSPTGGSIVFVGVGLLVVVVGLRVVVVLGGLGVRVLRGVVLGVVLSSVVVSSVCWVLKDEAWDIEVADKLRSNGMMV